MLRLGPGESLRKIHSAKPCHAHTNVSNDLSMEEGDPGGRTDQTIHQSCKMPASARRAEADRIIRPLAALQAQFEITLPRRECPAKSDIEPRPRARRDRRVRRRVSGAANGSQ